MNTRVIYSLLFYVLIMLLFAMIKPSVAYRADGTARAFGVGVDETLFSVGVFAMVLAISSFYMFCIIDIVCRA